ncbi:MAG: DNA polymerase III subunit gamma/tau, partial [Gammaproteobacteria bacterium]|nr:DNA polymerase III subunit gamma/tau [Gammaproteobacteria bacterium]
LATLLHRIALAQTIPQAIPDDEPERVRLMELAQQFTPEEIQLNYQIVIHGRNEIELAPDEYAGFTMTLLRMLAFAPQATGASPSSGVQQAAPRSAPTANVPQKAAEPAPARAAVAPSMSVGADLDWNTLLSQLNLSGMALQLAKNSMLASFTEGRVLLHLPPQHKHLQSNKIAQEKLQAALGEYFARPVRLEVEMGATNEVTTPAVVEQQDKQNRQQQAEDAIRQDAFVRDAQAMLGAQLIEGSIRPV